MKHIPSIIHNKQWSLICFFGLDLFISESKSKSTNLTFLTTTRFKTGLSLPILLNQSTSNRGNSGRLRKLYLGNWIKICKISSQRPKIDVIAIAQPNSSYLVICNKIWFGRNIARIKIKRIVQMVYGSHKKKNTNAMCCWPCCRRCSTIIVFSVVAW